MGDYMLHYRVNGGDWSEWEWDYADYSDNSWYGDATSDIIHRIVNVNRLEESRLEVQMIEYETDSHEWDTQPDEAVICRFCLREKEHEEQRPCLRSRTIEADNIVARVQERVRDIRKKEEKEAAEKAAAAMKREFLKETEETFRQWKEKRGYCG